MPNLNPRCIRKGNPILPIRTANQIPPLGKTLIRIQPLTATVALRPRIPAPSQVAAPSLPPCRRAIPDRKLPAPEASSLLRRTSSRYRCRFPGATPYDALWALGLSVNARSTAYGTCVAAIGGLAEKEHGGTSGWMYSVNGSTPMTACTNYVLSNGDVVVWYYVTG